MSTPEEAAGGSPRAELLRRLGEAGRDLSDAAVLYHTALAERLGLGASDWKTLGLLERHGPMTAGDLAERAGLAPPSVTGMIDRLERGGWVRRTRDPADKRRVVVELAHEVNRERQFALFGGLMRRLADLYERYTDDELSLVLDFMVETARRQMDATRELTEASGDDRVI